MLGFVLLGQGKELHKQDIKFSRHKRKCTDYIIIIFQKFLSGNNKHKTNQIKQDIDWKKDVQDTGPTIRRPCTNLRTDSGKKTTEKKMVEVGIGIIEEIQRAKVYVGKYSIY